MGVSKVIYNTENGAEVLMDLTGDTVTPEKLARGVTAHGADGNLITGTATEVNIVQTTGTSETDVMSQAAVTQKFVDVDYRPNIFVYTDKIARNPDGEYEGSCSGLLNTYGIESKENDIILNIVGDSLTIFKIIRFDRSSYYHYFYCEVVFEFGNFLTEIPSTYVTETELSSRNYATKDDVSRIPKFNIEVVDALPPMEVSATTVYLLPNVESSENMYREYIFVPKVDAVPIDGLYDSLDGVWEILGKQEFDLTDYVKKTEVPNIAYATCATAAATAEKSVVVSDPNWDLAVGSIVMVYFSASNSASNVTLNVNGTGAYPIWYNNAEYTSTGTAYTGYANRVIGYVFNGTHWVWIMQGYDSNTTYTNVKLGHGYATCTTAEATTAKVGTLSSYTLTVGGIVVVKFTNAVPAGSTLNINSKGAKKIFYRGAAITAGVIGAGDTATFIYDGTQYQLLTVDRKIETWTFTLEDGSTVTKKVVLA